MVKKDNYVIGTHNGIFHCDELVAISLFKILLKDIKNVQIIRSRDLKYLNEKCNVLIDKGEGKFDHHQKGGNGKRKNGASFASAGLVWKEYGTYIINKITNYNFSISDMNELIDNIDKEIIMNVDLEDNGENVEKHYFSFVNSFLPKWYEKEEYNKQFEEALNYVCCILENLLSSEISKKISYLEICDRLKNPKTKLNNVLIVPAQTIQWLEPVVLYNSKNNEKVDFVIFPYPDGGFALQCVPKSLDEKFSKRIELPENWAGETIKLPEISGISSAIMCHKGRFFARAKEFDDILKMCSVATYLYEEKTSLTRK